MNHTDWVQQAPYTAMLRQYRAAADALQQRLTELRAQLGSLPKLGTAESVQQQKLLEQRIQLLRTEYVEITDVIGAIGGYAEKEAQ